MVSISRKVLWAAFVLLSLYSAGAVCAVLEEIRDLANGQVPVDERMNRAVSIGIVAFMSGSGIALLIHWLVTLLK